MILTPNTSPRGRFFDIVFFLSTFLLPILSGISRILTWHVTYSLDKYVSGYQDVSNAFVLNGITGSKLGTAKFEFDEGPTKRANIFNLYGLFAGYSAVLVWWCASLNPNDSALGTVRKTPLPRIWAGVLFCSVSQSLIYFLLFTAEWFYAERHSWQSTGCRISMDEASRQIAQCTYESVACYVLDSYGIPGKSFTCLCWEARIAKWCSLGAFVCLCMLLKVYGAQELRRRKAMRFFLVETKGTREILKGDEEAKEQLGERTIENDIAEVAEGDEKK